MSKQIMLRIKKSLDNWSTRDLLVIAVISVAFAIILVGFSYLFVLFIIPLGLPARSAFQGLWYIPAIFIVYILRRPGAVLISETMIRLITVLFSPYGWLELVGLVVVVIPTELVFFSTGYRNYSLRILMLAGIAIALTRTVFTWLPLGINLLTTELQIAVILLAMVSGAAAAWIAKMLADSTTRTGVLNSYNVGQQQYREEI